MTKQKWLTLKHSNFNSLPWYPAFSSKFTGYHSIGLLATGSNGVAMQDVNSVIREPRPAANSQLRDWKLLSCHRHSLKKTALGWRSYASRQSDMDQLRRYSVLCSWTSSMELSAGGPQTAVLVIQPFQTVAEDIFIWAVGTKCSVNSPPPFNNCTVENISFVAWLIDQLIYCLNRCESMENRLYVVYELWLAGDWNVCFFNTVYTVQYF